VHKLTITLDKPYEIEELTVGQIEDIQDALGAFSHGTNTAILSKEANRTIIAIALSVDHPAVTRESIAKMRLGSVKKINAVVTQILRFGGFVDEAKSGTPKSGEAEAA
jgi:hypothetical protein